MNKQDEGLSGKFNPRVANGKKMAYVNSKQMTVCKCMHEMGDKKASPIGASRFFSSK